MSWPRPWTYLATAQAFDAEMAERIAVHRFRRNEGWLTVEAPLSLAEAVAGLDEGAPALVDCLTLWLSNRLLAGDDVKMEAERLADAVAVRRGPLCLVANEVGLGIVPENALARRFRDAAGLLSQRIAALADRVIFVAAGLPLVLKGKV
jgi:adenosylcobinamide kinase / adenosylcobinamide-phosphate guanylyltransferase